MSKTQKLKVCMLAYATYFTDARIKSYVKTLQEEGIETDIIALKEGGKKVSNILEYGKIYKIMKKYQGDSSIRYIISYFWFFIKVLFKLSLFQVTKKYRVIHVHNMPNFIVFSALIPKISGAKIILDIHDLMMANYMAKFGVNDRHFLIRILNLEQIISAWFSDHIICADHKQKDKLIEYGIKKNKITVIMNVPNEKIFKPVSVKKDSKRFNLVYHGTIAKRLGIDTLLRAVALIKYEIPVFLNIYGDGEFLKDCLMLKDELELYQNVFFSESFFPVEKIPEIVSKMDVGVIPNRKTLATNSFMMPVKLMEYVFLQKPVIAPRLEIIQHYFDDTMVKYFEPEDFQDLARCIVELYKSHDECKLLVRNANKFYLKYNWKNQEKKYLKLLHPTN